MMAKRKGPSARAAELLLGCGCGMALLGVSPAAGLERAATAWDAPDWLRIEWPDAGRVAAALPSPHVSVRVIVDVRP